MIQSFGAIEPAARIVVATLFNSLWEAALLAAAVALVLRVLPNVNATTRYAAWCVALVASMLLPLATALPQIAVQRTGPAAAAQRAVRPQPSTRVTAGAQRAVRAQAGHAAGSSASAFRMPRRLRFALPQYAALAIFAAWVAAALLFLVRLAINLWKLERLKSDALPLPVEYRERLERWSVADKGEREVRLCTCEGIDVPVAVGLFDSMILIPKHLLERLSQSDVDRILLHELAHLRRADDWSNGLQRFVQALFFFNPAVLYVAQQLDLEREVACDDWVLDQTKEVRPYAACLTNMAEVTAWPHRPLAAPGVFVTRRGLSIRVERLLRAGRDIRTRVSVGPAGATLAALVVIFFLLQSVAPSFAFTLPQEHALVAQAAPAPKASAAPAAHARKRTIEVNVPAQRVHVPAKTVHVPAMNVDLPARHLQVAMPSIPPLPNMHLAIPNVSRIVSRSLAQAFTGTGKSNCVGCDYSGQNLSGRSFRGISLSAPDFSRANLRNADFSNSVLVGADFSHADLRGANFSHAKLTGCDLRHALLEGAEFTGVTMVGCDFDARALAPAQAAAVLRACSLGCDFSYANLRGQNLRNLRLTGLDLSHADLRGADLSGANLEGVDLSGALLDGAHFNGTRITGCNLRGVNLHDVDLSKAQITGSSMN